MIASLDTETTGIDAYHGSAPFLVTMCYPDETPILWEWHVDVRTRRPIIPREDIDEIIERLQDLDEVVLQNAKFDIGMLNLIDPRFRKIWEEIKVHDTILSGHLLHSGLPLDLTSMTSHWLKYDISRFEYAVQEASNRARTIARSKLKLWRIAKEGDPMLPSAKGEKLWKFDMWLPREVAKYLGYPARHPWHTVTSKYASGDSACTLPLHFAHMEEIRRQKLEDIYNERLKLILITHTMERIGLTCNLQRRNEQYEIYKRESGEAEARCVALSNGRLDKLPKGGSSKALEGVLFDEFKLVSPKLTKKAKKPSTDKDAIAHWLATLPEQSPAYDFVKNLVYVRQRRTAMGFMEGYLRAGIPVLEGQWIHLHPSLNMTGTSTLRWTSNNPNEQNISKKPGFNLRYMFGPPPGREWWALDYSNIELRIPAYESGEQEMINLFERPDDPPYFGSNHLLVAHVLHPREFEECLRTGKDFKKEYKSTLYQWTKNGNFAVQYGAMEESGTADRAYHVKGGQAKVQARFKNIAKLNKWCIQFAQEHGYIETIRDREFGRGYPLQCEFYSRGNVKPTIPLNYRVQGTAMWCMMRAMIRCNQYLRELGPMYKMILQVHDELVFDFPAGKGLEPWRTNLSKIEFIKGLMEQSGNDIGLPLTVSVSYHPNTYDQEIAIAI